MNNAATMLKHSRRWALAIAALIAAADQLSKLIIIHIVNLQNRGQIELLPFFNLTWVKNYGVSFGMLTATGDVQRWALVTVTAIIALGVFVWIRRETQRGDIFALALVLGGAVGNIIDRARLGFVVDFLDLHIGGFRPFLVFNIADAAISIGVAILLIRALFLPARSGEDKEALVSEDAQ